MKYEIIGGNLPVALVQMVKGEAVYCQSGAMSWMDEGIEMQTEGGGFGKVLGRAFSGESLFRNRYVAQRNGEIAFSGSFPGEIRALEVGPGRSIIAQKGSFLACDESVEMSVFFQKKLAGGLFGGEGFIMQKFAGRGTVLIEVAGTAVEYELRAGERKIIDTGYLVMMEDTCSMDIQQIKGVKNIFMGGEGLFNTVVTGPGKVMIQSMPVNKMADMLRPYFPSASK